VVDDELLKGAGLVASDDLDVVRDPRSGVGAKVLRKLDERQGELTRNPLPKMPLKLLRIVDHLQRKGLATHLLDDLELRNAIQSVNPDGCDLPHPPATQQQGQRSDKHSHTSSKVLSALGPVSA